MEVISWEVVFREETRREKEWSQGVVEEEVEVEGEWEKLLEA